MKNARRPLQNGLSQDAAIRALTLQRRRRSPAPPIAWARSRAGKIANVVVTEGDLFDEKTTIKHVFVNGRPVTLPR